MKSNHTSIGHAPQALTQAYSLIEVATRFLMNGITTSNSFLGL